MVQILIINVINTAPVSSTELKSFILLAVGEIKLL